LYCYEHQFKFNPTDDIVTSFSLALKYYSVAFAQVSVYKCNKTMKTQENRARWLAGNEEQKKCGVLCSVMLCRAVENGEKNVLRHAVGMAAWLETIG
jgi:hypothetical protein